MNLGEPIFMSNIDRNPTSREGITCIVCHRVNRAYGKISGRVSLVEGDLTTPVYGPRGDNTELQKAIKSGGLVTDSRSAGRKVHAKVEKFFALTTPGFCATCHDVTLANGFRLEEAFSEYKSSPAARQGITCQDCHMGKAPGRVLADKSDPDFDRKNYAFGPAARVAGRDTAPRMLTNHMFVGPDYSVLPAPLFPLNLRAIREESQKNDVTAPGLATIRQWLTFDYKAGWGTDAFENKVSDSYKFPSRWASADNRYDARDIVDANLKLLKEMTAERLKLLQAGYLLGEVRTLRADAGGIRFKVQVKNGTTGHNVPTGFDGERLVWLYVRVLDADGRVIAQSGDLDPNGDLRDLHSAYVHNHQLPLDKELFSLQGKFLVRMLHGGEREQVLAVNISPGPLPYVRPEVQSDILIGRPAGARKQKLSIEPGGSRWATYTVESVSAHGPRAVPRGDSAQGCDGAGQSRQRDPRHRVRLRTERPADRRESRGGTRGGVGARRHVRHRRRAPRGRHPHRRAMTRGDLTAVAVLIAWSCAGTAAFGVTPAPSQTSGSAPAAASSPAVPAAGTPAPKKARTSRISDDSVPALDVEHYPARPKPLIELGPRFLGNGDIGPGFRLPTGAAWTPQLIAFGTYRTAVQSVRNPVTGKYTSKWSNRLDLYTNLQLSGTERLLVGFRPLDNADGATGYNFTPGVFDRGDHHFNAQLHSLFFEGEIGEIFPNLDPLDRKHWDIGFSVGRQQFAMEDGLLINDDAVDAVGLTKNNIMLRGTSNLQVTGLFGWGGLNGNDTLPRRRSQLFAIVAAADAGRSSYQRGAVLCERPGRGERRDVPGPSARRDVTVGSTRPFASSARHALHHLTPLANAVPVVDTGHLLFSENLDDAAVEPGSRLRRRLLGDRRLHVGVARTGHGRTARPGGHSLQFERLRPLSRAPQQSRRRRGGGRPRVSEVPARGWPSPVDPRGRRPPEPVARAGDGRGGRRGVCNRRTAGTRCSGPTSMRSTFAGAGSPVAGMRLEMQLVF